jgi:hypothetical protein
MKQKGLIALFLVCALLAGCTQQGVLPGNGGTTDQGSSQQDGSANASIPAGSIDTSNLFTDRDLKGDVDDGAVQIMLNESTGSTVTITEKGTYVISGSMSDGMIIVDAAKSDKVQLVLNGVSINSASSAAIYVKQADKVFITLAAGTENTLTNGGTFTAIDDNNIDAVIYSKEDLTLNGSGILTVSSPAGHGVVSKDDLTVAGGSYRVTAASHGFAGEDNVCITGASLDITAGKDGIRSENADDAELGFVYIKDGTFAIDAEGDGISASAQLQVDAGTFRITAGGGSSMGSQNSNRPIGGGYSDTTEDTVSCKGLKATAELRINGGSFTIDSADDAVHSNLNIFVSGGVFSVSSGDDGFHADETLTVSSGNISILGSYEGLEGLHIVINGGSIDLVASDDGLNAAGGTDQSGFGGGFGNDQFGGGRPGSRPGGRMGGMPGSVGNGSIVISGGTLKIKASGDGIDANGTLEITGGYTTVCGPTQGDTATLDYDTSAVISGGTFIGTGGAGMAQTFSDSKQGLLSLRVDNQPAGTQIILKDSQGNVIVEHSPELSFAIVIISTPEMKKRESYTITVGSQSGEFTAN